MVLLFRPVFSPANMDQGFIEADRLRCRTPARKCRRHVRFSNFNLIAQFCTKMTEASHAHHFRKSDRQPWARSRLAASRHLRWSKLNSTVMDGPFRTFVNYLGFCTRVPESCHSFDPQHSQILGGRGTDVSDNRRPSEKARNCAFADIRRNLTV